VLHKNAKLRNQIISFKFCFAIDENIRSQNNNALHQPLSFHFISFPEKWVVLSLQLVLASFDPHNKYIRAKKNPHHGGDYVFMSLIFSLHAD
jgi:hypothetical protein